VRLTFYLVLTAALFPSSRFILLFVLLITLGVLWTRDFRRNGSRKIFYLAAAVGILVIGYGLGRVNVVEVDEARLTKSPWGNGISLVEDGTYVGEGQGFRGPIEVRVKVKNHRIVGIQTLKYPDLISVQDNEITLFKKELLEKGRLERPEQPQMYRGAPETLTGYTNAIESALSKGILDFPRYNVFSRIFFSSFIGAAPDRVTLNALAILFAAFTVFEYALQSMLTPGTGRSINCYNCATCVGACPVKEVEGVQMPMGLVLLTRLGNYERVMELSKYCVGCGRCAAKCPIGNSGPLVISAAFQAARKQKQQERLQEQEEPA
jgi:ferredoxin